MKNITDLSLILPIRNEEKFIDRCLQSILAQDYPQEKMEVLLVDGMSEDKTREIIEGYCQKHSNFRLLDNPQKVTPNALNTGITEAKGNVIIRMDAHAHYQKDYVTRCLQYLHQYGADNVGGIMITLPQRESLIGYCIVKTLGNRFGVGDSYFRIHSKETKWVDTVFGGCYKKEVFQEIGLFNEALLRGQDMEFNLRLKKSGGKILLVPEIVSYYYARSDFKSFLKHNYKNGYWVVYAINFTRHLPVSWRHLVPLAFVSSLLLSAGLSLAHHLFSWLFLAIVGAYSFCDFYFSAKIALKEKNFRYLLLMPLIFPALHISYGLGSLAGLGKLIFSKNFWRSRFSALFNQKQGVEQ